MAESNFSQVVQEQSLLANVASSFNDPASFPDLTVVFDETTSWLCHKMIICKRSGYFHAMIAGGFQESGASIIQVHDHDPYAIEAGLEFCYKLNGVSFRDRAHAGNMSIAVFHVRLFQVAEYYAIKGLEGLAADGFIQAINSDEITTQQLAEAFEAAYELTGDPDKLLRKAILEKTLSNVKFYLGDECPPFSELTSVKSLFMVDVAKAMAKNYASPDTTGGKPLYDCPYCNMVGRFSAPEIETGRPHEVYTHECAFCTHSFTKKIAVWRKRHMVKTGEEGEGWGVGDTANWSREIGDWNGN